MKLKNIFAVLVFALAAPIAASAATLTINNVFIDSFTDPTELGTIDINVLDTADVNVSFVDSDTGGTLVFSLNNVSDNAAAYTIVGGTVDQGAPIYGFSQGVNLWLENPDLVGVALDGESFDFNTVIAAGDSAIFSFEYGDPYGVGNIGPDIDFTVYATVVPIPAAGFLLIGALGGLAALRRRKA